MQTLITQNAWILFRIAFQGFLDRRHLKQTTVLLDADEDFLVNMCRSCLSLLSCFYFFKYRNIFIKDFNTNRVH